MVGDLLKRFLIVKMQFIDEFVFRVVQMNVAGDGERSSPKYKSVNLFRRFIDERRNAHKGGG